MTSSQVLDIVQANTQRAMDFSHTSLIVMLIVALLMGGSLIFTAIFFSIHIEKAAKQVIKAKKPSLKMWSASEYGAWAAKQLEGFSSAFDTEGVGADILAKLNGTHPDNLTNEDFQAILNKNMGSR